MRARLAGGAQDVVAGEVDPERVLGAVDAAAGVEMGDDLGDRLARVRRCRRAPARRGRGRRSAPAASSAGRSREKSARGLAIARGGVVPSAERRQRMAADAEQDRLQVAVLQAPRRSAVASPASRSSRQRRRAGRRSGAMLHSRYDSLTRWPISADESPAALEQLERGLVVAEQLLGLAEVVDRAALHRAIADWPAPGRAPAGRSRARRGSGRAGRR